MTALTGAVGSVGRWLSGRRAPFKKYAACPSPAAESVALFSGFFTVKLRARYGDGGSFAGSSSNPQRTDGVRVIHLAFSNMATPPLR